MFQLKAGLHRFPSGVFGSTSNLIRPQIAFERDTLMLACSGQGSAPDNVSFAQPGRISILQHIGALVPSKVECENHAGLSFNCAEQLFDRYEFRHVIVCGHLDCRIIRDWLQPHIEEHTNLGIFRRSFDLGARGLVDRNYSPKSAAEHLGLVICEHVLCQIENMLTHPFIMKRVMTEQISFHGWVVDDQTARIFAYNLQQSAFVPI